MREPIKEFKPTAKSSEFLRFVVGFTGLFATQFFISDFNAWAIATGVICSAFSIARGLHKKSRLAILGKGERTTEFYISMAGTFAVLARILTGDVTAGVGLIVMAATESSYYLSRGQGKSFSPAGPSTVHSVR